MNRIIYLFTTLLILLPVIIFSQINYNNNNVNNPGLASAVGEWNTAQGLKSFTGGYNNTADGTASFAFGQNNIAQGQASFATGNYSIAQGDFTTALGYKAESITDLSISIGRNVRTSAGQSITIGLGYTLTNSFLINAVPNSFMIGMNSTAPTIFVSESPSDLNHTNRTGQVAIGNVPDMDPQAKLHIYADDNEDATLFLQPSNWGSFNPEIWFGNMFNKISAKSNLGMIYNTGRYHSFQDGNVGIGLEVPEYTLDVNGDINLSGNLLHNGIMISSPWDEEEGNVYYLEGNVGIGINRPLSKLEVMGQVSIGYNVAAPPAENNLVVEGNVGIGTFAPTEKLDVNGNILVNDAISGKISIGKGWNDPDYLSIKGSEDSEAGKILIPKGNNPEHNALKIINPGVDGGIQFHTEGVINFNIRRDEVVIGRPDHEMQVKVNGKILSHEVEVKLADWWDEVFDKEYTLMPLNELDKYIQQNHHLPDLPTEDEVLENGIELGEMNALLLKKIEELTLYMIELKKELEEVKQASNQTTTR